MLLSNLRQIGIGLHVYMVEHQLAVFPVSRLEQLGNNYLVPIPSLRASLQQKQYRQSAARWGLGLILLWLVTIALVFHLNRGQPLKGMQIAYLFLFVIFSGSVYLVFFRGPSVPAYPSSSYVDDYVYIEGVRADDNSEVILAYEDPSMRPKSPRLATLFADLHAETVPRAKLDDRLKRSRERMQKRPAH